jgi:hypothetical protein
MIARLFSLTPGFSPVLDGEKPIQPLQRLSRGKKSR